MSKRLPHNSKSPSPAPSRSPIGSKASSSNSLSEDTRLRESLCADLEVILSDESTSDLEFIVEQERVKAHRLIVLARCEKFRNNKGTWLGREQEQRDALVTVDLSNQCTVEGVRAVVKYLYTGKVCDDIYMTSCCIELSYCCSLILPSCIECSGTSIVVIL